MMYSEEKMWFHRALQTIIYVRRLVPQAHIVGYGDGEVFVAQGEKMFTIERVSHTAVALVDEAGTTRGKWLVR